MERRDLVVVGVRTTWRDGVRQCCCFERKQRAGCLVVSGATERWSESSAADVRSWEARRTRGDGSCRCSCPSVGANLWSMVDGQRRDSSLVVCVGGDGSLVRERRDCLVEAVAWYEASVVGRGQSTTVVSDGSNVGLFVSSLVDSSLVRERGDCLVEAVAWFEARVGCLVRSECRWSGRQATTILLITLEVANSKAKSEGIQIYCYK